jgi:hypothetical protein
MHYKTNRQNHDFQILHFIVGSCHTADGAYGILCDLEEDRSNAIKQHTASKLREKAKRLAAQQLIDSGDEIPQLEGQADIAEIEAMAETTQRCYDAAIDELAFIQLLKARLESHRKFAHLPIREAHQAAQPEEWKFELMKRAENYLLSGGGIPADHFGTMRMHPAWEGEIQPHIKAIIASAQAAQLALQQGKPIPQAPMLVTPLAEVKLDTLLLENKPSI